VLPRPHRLEARLAPPEYLTKAELAERLQLTPQTIENLVNQGRLPYLRLTRRIIRFSWPDVVAAMNSRRFH
jgi:excisionase family DNA binding protein